MAVKKKPSKATVYSEDIIEVICSRIEAGEAIRNICNEADMPNWKSFRSWLLKHEYAATQYAHAREAQADLFAEQIKQLADAPLPVSKDEKGKVDMNAARVELERRKMQIDAHKWTASRLNPKNWGDAVKHTGADGGPIKHENVSPLEDLDSRLASIAERGAATEDPEKLH